MEGKIVRKKEWNFVSEKMIQKYQGKKEVVEMRRH